ncbi:pseudoazurin [Agarivorans sp. Z349TD_8]|uniref:pseudoazurin n=1 Tax=Agarivorans sp. Z349TD_8 TaxID=3421434 RepID=UPI003D7D12AC
MSSKYLILALLACLSVSPLSAKEWQVKMLSYGDAGSMVFEPAFLQAEVGDSVTFVPSQSGHFVKSYVVPEGASGWASKMDQAYTITLDQQGLFLYYCPPHLMMGMVGLIQVGEAVNKATFEQKYPRLRAKVALSPERVDAVVAQIK